MGGVSCLDVQALNPDRAPLKEVLGGQYNYREGGRQVLRQGANSPAGNRRFLGKSLNFWQKHQLLHTDSFSSIFQNKMKTPAQFSKNGRFFGIFQDGRQIPQFFP